MKAMVYFGLSILILSVLPAVTEASEHDGIPPETVADYIHAVIEADRTFYTIHVVERLQKGEGPVASEDWRAKKNLLPLPAQFLRESSDLAAKTGSTIRYRLISLWPINPDNGPYGDVERKGLETVRDHPERAATTTVTVGKQVYLQAIYPDHAVSHACIACHNAHPRSPKRDFKMNDVMGGLLIEIPLNK